YVVAVDLIPGQDQRGRPASEVGGRTGEQLVRAPECVLALAVQLAARAVQDMQRPVSGLEEEARQREPGITEGPCAAQQAQVCQAQHGATGVQLDIVSQ